MDVVGGRAVAARDLIDAMLGCVRPALEDAGEWDEVSEMVTATLARGTGATRQRAAYARRRRIGDVVDLIVAETVGR